MSWATPLNDLQAGLALAASPGSGVTMIHVAQGYYVPTGGSTAAESTFKLVPGVSLLGGYAGFGAADPEERDPLFYRTFLRGGDPPPAAAPVDCCSGGPGPGCVSPVCTEKVCEFHPPCCSGEWGTLCVAFAQVLCSQMCHPAQPSPSISDRLHVVWSAGGDTGTILDGFTVYGAKAYGQAPPGIRGGGLYVASGSLIVRNCIFADNRALSDGGGAWVNGLDVLFEDCAFLRNWANDGGGMTMAGDQLTLRRCRFSEHRPVISPVAGGALVLGSDCNATVSDCTFDRNERGHGGAVRNSGSAEFTNCLFHSNKTTATFGLPLYGFGGAIANWGPLTLINCTFAHNSATVSGGAVHDSGGKLRAANCIFWDNTAPSGFFSGQIALASNLSFISYSCIQGLVRMPLGVGNIGLDPLFVDPLGADGLAGTGDESFRIQPLSPCIDRGDNAAVPAGVVTDLDGLARFVDILGVINRGLGRPPIVDMGAYEVQR